jgi:DNA-binding NtrC family response regulator
VDEVDLSELDGLAGRTDQLASPPPTQRGFEVTGVAGPGAAVRYRSTGQPCAIGSHAGNEIIISDPTLSRSHCELRVEGGRLRLVDLDSTNGTVLDGVPIAIGYPRDGSAIQIGRTTLRVTLGDAVDALPLSPRTQFGELYGGSVAMRGCFALLERAAASDSTVLLEGESGTGKERAAQAIHLGSPRAGAPFVIVDCSAIPANLLESELFGHERGAFTGATEQRRGVFEAANGGTVFLDEIGELPIDLQPKLLRVLEQREIRRVGGTKTVALDLRIVAATNRDLRAEVNANRFRADLYYRLAVVRVVMPPLRQRPEDLPVLVERIVGSLGVDPAVAARLRAPELLATLARGAWPGNVRELRNLIERYAVLDGADLSHELAAPDDEPPPPFTLARDRVLAEFERRYVEQLLRAHRGNVSAAARASGIDRTYFHRLMRRHNLGR